MVVPTFDQSSKQGFLKKAFLNETYNRSSKSMYCSRSSLGCWVASCDVTAGEENQDFSAKSQLVKGSAGEVVACS